MHILCAYIWKMVYEGW